MTYSENASRISVLWRSTVSRLTSVGRDQLVVAIALLVVVILRLLPASYLAGLDSVLGRPGDSILLLLAIMLVVVSVRINWVKSEQVMARIVPSGIVSDPVVAILDMHLRLDHEIDLKLNEVIEDTETSALGIIQNVRKLFDTASNLVSYLDKSNIKGGALEQEIVASVAFIVEIGSFIEQLPSQITRDLKNVQSIVTEIKGLGGLVQAVHDISLQSHLLAINAAIEASRAGTSGAAFRVVADEMRILASNSNGVAKKINDGLSRAQHVLEHGMAASIASSSQELDQVTHAVESIKSLQHNFEDISQYYKTRFLVVTKHNQDLANDIGDALGAIQYQDVVRQCVDRIRFVIGRRNAFLKNTVEKTDDSLGADNLLQLPVLLELIRLDYLEEEDKHKHSGRHAIGVNAELKIELF